MPRLFLLPSLAPLALAVPLPAIAQTAADVSLASSIYVEQVDPDHGPLRRLAPAVRLTKGDRVVTLVQWVAHGRPTGFTLSNALPPALAFERAGAEASEVSVDGGHSWGRLGRLRRGGRLAMPEEVTNLRWRISPDAARAGSGRIAYSGVVR